MQELELTWSQVARIWWAGFWRWLILANLAVGVCFGTVAIALWAVGVKRLPDSIWLSYSVLVPAIPAALMALRLAIKTPYKGFRVTIIALPEPVVREV